MNKALKANQIRWQCRRGMLELDVILESFYDMHYDQLNDKEKGAFQQLLDMSDPVLYRWLLFDEQPDVKSLCLIIEKIKRRESSL